MQEIMDTLQYSALELVSYKRNAWSHEWNSYNVTSVTGTKLFIQTQDPSITAANPALQYYSLLTNKKTPQSDKTFLFYNAIVML